VLGVLVKKAQSSGTFEAVLNAVDKRAESEKGELKLHPGYSIQAGTRGSKLSGG